jgi:hypothetical protein
MLIIGVDKDYISKCYQNKERMPPHYFLLPTKKPDPDFQIAKEGGCPSQTS